MKSLLGIIKNSPPFQLISDAVAAGRPIDVFGVTPSFKPCLLAALASLPARGLLWVTSSWDGCERAYEWAYPFLPDNMKERFHVFPEVSMTDGQDTASTFRLKALKALSDDRPACIVAPFRALIQECEDFSLMRKDSLLLEEGMTIPQESLIDSLEEMGYERNHQVERRGEYSVRGGIIDVFPSTADPVRLDFFGDVADTIRSFDLDTQVSTGKLSSILIYPRKEYGREKKLLELLPESWVVAVDDPQVIKFHAVERNFEEERDLWSEFQYALKDRRPVSVLSWSGEKGIGACFATRPLDSMGGNIEKLLEEMARWQEAGESIIVSTQQEARFKGLLREKGIKGVARDGDSPLGPGKIHLLPGDFHEGFLWEDARLRLITDKDILGAMPRKKRVLRAHDKIKSVNLSDLKPGDPVVHISHGIGRFQGMAHLEIQGVTRDFVELEYARGDKLYVPIQQLDLLQKYIGPEEKAASLSRLGGAEWIRTRQKVEKAAKEIADYLLALYSERENTPGHAFSLDTVWQWELEASFPFEETQDQDRAIQEVKHDMESSRSMDRLLCGDAGHGKTEVALRAAFKAVQDGRQVALLVPTTILAHQHYDTFFQRLRPFPVEVALLSRFKTPKEQKEAISRLATREVDIVVGTHRLLSKDVSFKELGLLIVDEEQHFGVRQKEKMKKLKANVDVLTMTATPIPRTLHMSMTGIRDLSVIETPPDDRLPVRTYLFEYDRELVRSAIIREMERGGQVYFVNHRVQGIERLAHEIRELVPFARVAVGHGQMDDKELEMVMLDFIDGSFDVLVCTTIIESGLDIPNVNTIIVNNAHRFGLSQLYQLRGRVGRSNRQSYAYLLYPPHQSLTEDAQKRLEVIRDFSHLGASFKIAMKDLEIRGAGNLLGAEQSGHIAAVGFELYCQLLKEAIEEKRGKARERKVESPLIDLPVDTFIPQDYIESPQVRLEMYRKVARIEKEEEIAGLAAQFQDRFGPVPLSLQYLLDIFRIKLLAWDLGVPSIKESKGVVQVLLPGVEKMSLKMMQELFEASRVACHFHRSVLTLEDLLGRRKKMLAPDGDFDPPRLWIGKLEKILRRLMEWKGQGKI